VHEHLNNATALRQSIFIKYKDKLHIEKMSKKKKTYEKKEDLYVPREQDLFSNPMITAAMAAMSNEDKEKYRQIGEQMYGHMNFEDARHLINPEVRMTEALACLESQLRSGLHPSDMEDNEKAVLSDAYGDNWYEKWGFVKKDLSEITTTKK